MSENRASQILATVRPFDSEIYDAHVAMLREPNTIREKIIIPLDDPLAVPAAQADFMRDDDYVVGIVVGDTARAYPLHHLNCFHLTNDVIEGEPIVVMA